MLKNVSGFVFKSNAKIVGRSLLMWLHFSLTVLRADRLIVREDSLQKLRRQHNVDKLKLKELKNQLARVRISHAVRMRIFRMRTPVFHMRFTCDQLTFSCEM